MKTSLRFLSLTSLKQRAACAAALSLVLAACGGGGGGGGGDEPAVLPVWQGAQFVESQGGNANAVSVAVQADGVGHAIWTQLNPGATHIEVLSSIYRSGRWEAPQPVSSRGALPDVFLHTPQIVSLGGGVALAVWRESSPAGNQVFFNVSNGQGEWPNTASSLQQGVDFLADFKLVGDDRGNAMAVWRRNQTVFASRFSGDIGTFQVIEQISIGTSGGAISPDIAMDADGRCVAAWVEQDAGVDRIYARAFSGAGWGGEVELSSSDFPVFAPSVALGRNGKAVVSWTSSRASQSTDVIATQAIDAVARTWGPEQRLNDASEPHASVPRSTISSNGNAVVVWKQIEGGGNVGLQAARSLGTTWSAPIKVDTPAGEAGSHQAVMDAAGRVVVVWAVDAGVPGIPIDLYSSRLEPGTSKWGAPERIELIDGIARSPSLAVNGAGRAIVAWEQVENGFPSIGNVVANILE